MSEDVATTAKKEKVKSKLKDDHLDSSKFRGEGVVFKGKIIGTVSVPQARGDKMCQEAMQKVKLDVKAAGVHKQKVNIQVTLDGMKILGERLGRVQYQHAVHRISFISRDVNDARAFGYVFGNQDGSHTFFGIKTEKASENLVLTLRDLFQVVFELKKKEMERKRAVNEKAKEENDGSKITNNNNTEENSQPMPGRKDSEYDIPKAPVVVTSGDDNNEAKSENVGTLLDLETELESLQQGIQQMNAFQVQPSPFLQQSPDSFGAQSAWPSPLSQQTFPDSQNASTDPFGMTSPAFPTALESKNPSPPLATQNPFVSGTNSNNAQQGTFNYDKYSVFQDVGTLHSPSLFSSGTPLMPTPVNSTNTTLPDPFNISPLLPKKDIKETEKPDSRPTSKPASRSTSLENLFEDLDPLGSNRRFVPKEEMFADLKVQPKISLRDLTSSNNIVDKVKLQSNSGSLRSDPSTAKNPSPTPLTLSQSYSMQHPAVCRRNEAEFNMPSPAAPPPPLPENGKLILSDVGPVPPPRPQQLNTSGIPRINPPAPVPRQSVKRTTQSEVTTSTDGGIGSNQFFTSSSGQHDDDAFAKFELQFPADPFFEQPSNGGKLQEPVYATVNKDGVLNS